MAEKNIRTTRFISYVLAGLRENPAMGARLRRADNASTEHQAWEYFARFGVDLQDARSVKAYATVSAALARAKPEQDGTFSFGQSLAAAGKQREGDGQDNPTAVRLRRVLSCRTTEEACEVLRPILKLIADKNTRPLCYERLLRDLLYFGDATKRRWASDFYGRTSDAAQEEEGDAP